uniref:Knr4/Smi1-like domain-containing protein n=1 Tax=Knipowitschia caucasica TaxID=637954 RepID=A0AAV2M5V8_KNICA
MDEVKDDASFKGVADRLTLGVLRILENLPGVTDVRFPEREPAEKRSLLNWEQKNACILPEDLRDFYLTTDGFRLHWNVKLDNGSAPLGRMDIHSVSRLSPLLPPTSVFSLPNAASVSDLDWDQEPGSSLTPPPEAHPTVAPPPPHFDARSRIFELDSCGGNGKVCLVYNNCTPGVVAQLGQVWFLDRSLRWFFFTSSFTSFFRLMITHLGLPEWHYNCTSYGPSPLAQWAALYPPLTFSDPQDTPTTELNCLDPSRAFKTRTKTPPKKRTGTQGGGARGGGRGRGRS